MEQQVEQNLRTEGLKKELSFRESMTAAFPIQGNVTLTLYDAAHGNRDTTAMFHLWRNLDARICRNFLKLGNNWRQLVSRPRWVVVMEKNETGHKHLHGMVAYENAPAWKAAFEAAFAEDWKLHGWTAQSDLVTDERGWVKYMMKTASVWAYDHDHFDFRVSPNCPQFRDLETSQ